MHAVCHYKITQMEISNKMNLTFKVVRKNPELIAPAKPTPHELKLLSDIDGQEALRMQVIEIQFYRRNPSAEGKDPVKVIRDAIGKALVFYYPFAGRLRESAAGKQLVVECTGEGVVFIEADADVALQQLGDALYPPFPYLDKLLNNVPGTTGIINCPLLLIQVTRLRCGGFVFAIRFNHTVCDGAGLVQFMSAVGELARGAEAPSVVPVWQRHLLNARNPARVACTHHEYDDIVPETGGSSPSPPENLVDRSFLFNTTDISALRTNLPPHLRRCSAFEIVVACTWRCRAIALSQDPTEEIRISCVVDCRKRSNPPLPEGYYGNAFVYPAVATTAENLSRGPLQYALELVRNAKSQATDEYIKSVADLMVMRGRVLPKVKGSYIVSDLTRMDFGEVDFGWGPAVYGGPAKCSNDHGQVFGYVLPCKNVNGIVVTMRLPAYAMDKFINELETTIATARKSLIHGASML